MKSLEIEWRKDKGGRGTVFRPEGAAGFSRISIPGNFQ
jgi:hypothetical protein